MKVTQALDKIESYTRNELDSTGDSCDQASNSVSNESQTMPSQKKASSPRIHKNFVYCGWKTKFSQVKRRRQELYWMKDPRKWRARKRDISFSLGKIICEQKVKGESRCLFISHWKAYLEWSPRKLSRETDRRLKIANNKIAGFANDDFKAKDEDRSKIIQDFRG